MFKILQLVAIGVYMLMSILGMGAVNGFYRAHVCFSSTPIMVLPGILCIFEGFLYWIITFLSILVFFGVIKHQKGEPLMTGPQDLNTD